MELWKDKTTLKRLYVDEGLSQSEIAERLGCARTTVGNWIRRHSIERPAPDRPWQDETVLRSLYVDDGLSARDVADRLGTSHNTVLKWLRKTGVGSRRPNQDKPPSFTMRGGYESWCTHDGVASRRVYVHRLLAVAEYGYDAVADRDVHHTNGIPWDNRPSNVEPIEKSAHTKLHMSDSNGVV